MEKQKLETHVFSVDFWNEFGEYVQIVTCPFVETTLAIINRDTCACGIAL